MNSANIVGGGLIILALGWLAGLLMLGFMGVPRIPLMFKAFLYLTSAITSTLVGLGILLGGVGPFGITTEVSSLLFVACQTIGVWGFGISMGYHVLRNTTLVDTAALAGITRVTSDTNRRVQEGQSQRLEDRPLEKADQAKTDPHRAATEHVKKRLDDHVERMDASDKRMDRSDERQDASEEREEGKDG